MLSPNFQRNITLVKKIWTLNETGTLICVEDSTCKASVTIEGYGRARGKWFDIWAAGVEINTLCIKYGLVGKVENIGKHLLMERCLEAHRYRRLWRWSDIHKSIEVNIVYQAQ